MHGMKNTSNMGIAQDYVLLRALLCKRCHTWAQ